MSSVLAPCGRRSLGGRPSRTVERLLDATVDEVREVGYAGLTVRGVARRAGVSAATAYTYFASKDHLLAEVFRGRLVDLPETVPAPASAGAAARVAAVLGAVVLLVADEPELAAACTVALFATDHDDVRQLRQLIGAEMHRRLLAALGDDPDPVAVGALELAVTGAMVQAGLGHVSYWELPERLAEASRLILGQRP
jgi:AcrR family transcriptional regulator